MEDYDAWEAVSKLLQKLEWAPKDKKYSDGKGRVDIITYEVCPICGNKKEEGHKMGCELNSAIGEIGSVLYK